MKEAKEAKRAQITEQICKQAQLMRRGGANQSEIARLLGVNACSVSRIEAAGFDFGKYTENQKARREREKQQKAKPEETERPAEEVAGQICMELTPAEEPKPEMSEQTKMMRFLAGQADKMIIQQAQWMDEICMKLNKLNDTMSQILRAIRRE